MNVWSRQGNFEAALRSFSVDFRALVKDVESAYKLGHRDIVEIDVRPYDDFVAWAQSQTPDWDRYTWDGTKVLVEQKRLPKAALSDYDNPDLKQAGIATEEWLRLGFEHYVDSIAESIASGKSVPPLVAVEGKPIDGRHRALAAHRLGLYAAPIIDLRRKPAAQLDREIAGALARRST